MSIEFRAYYYTFDATGVPAVDKILEAVAAAGKSYHHTEDWSDEIVGRIQAAAASAAKVQADLLSAIKAIDNALCDGFTTQQKRMSGRKALIAVRAAIAAAEQKG